MTHHMKAIIKTVATIALLLPVFSYAAPELIVTWRAASYAPEGYAGKTLPIAGTPIDASAILIDGGKAISLAPYEINWYAGEDRITGGKGAVSARMTAPITGQDSFELRVNVAKYNNQPLDAFLTIPVVRPEILIMKRGGTQSKDFSIIPYFWNIMKPTELEVVWSEDGGSITARATNKKNEMEFAQIAIPKQ